MSANLSITLPDGSVREYATGVTGAEIAQSIGRGLAKAAIGATVDGELVDLARPIDHDAAVAIVTADSEAGREMVRHSTSHLMAQAVFDLFPGAKYAIGPSISDGFYYDFELPDGVHFHDDDLERIEARMRELVKENQAFVRAEYGSDEGLALFADQPFKIEIIRNVTSGTTEEGDADEVTGDGTVGVYTNVRADGSTAYVDLCRGPHVPSTGKLGAFKLTRVAGAYWRGDEKRPQLQRIYGTAWESKAALEEHLHRVAEAERRDHRKLGVELDLFSFPDEIGSGLAVFHPKGGTVRRVMEDYSRAQHEAANYEFVYSPHITKANLFETSGHLQWYAEGMYPPMELDAEYGEDGELKRAPQKYYMKPMNCPMHNLIFDARGRSYRELPLRLFEFGTVYRYEKSGVIQGLTRARGFTQDDAHIYCTPEQMPGELDSLLTFVLNLLRDYGLEDFYLELSTKDPVKFVGSDDDWERATETLRQAAERQNLELVMDPGGAAFYGPKISVQARDAIGRTWQMSTIQVDFNLPQRFELEYTAADGSHQRPVMIHRALFGSIERFFAVLLEHYAGAFPVWLAPVQVVGIPITDGHVDYLNDVAVQLRAAGIRIDVDTSDDRMQKKIRNAQKQKVPFMLIAGDEDVASGAVSFRYRDGTQKNGVPVAEAIGEIVDAVQRRVQV